MVCVGVSKRLESHGVRNLVTMSRLRIWMSMPLCQLQKERTLLQVKHLTRMVEAGIDAILAPTTAYIASKNGEPKRMSYKWFHRLGLFKSLIPIRFISGQGA